MSQIGINQLKKHTIHTLSTVEQILNEARMGRMFLLIDHEERENEGDLIIAASHATADAINFMATHGRGLICLALTEARVDALKLKLQPVRNGSSFETAFTQSIEAATGITTGISASDRSRTIGVASDPSCGADDIVSPGHVFPLRARNGGVIVRAGHTEASIDICRIAEVGEAAVICEVLHADGSMARLPDLIQFSIEHDLRIGSISDLIEWREHHEPIVHKTS